MVAGEPVTADRPRVALLQPFALAIVERIRALTEPDGFRLDTVADADPVACRAALATADYAVVVSVALNAADLDHVPRLRLVHKWGAGVDNLPLDALRTRRIPVLRTAAINGACGPSPSQVGGCPPNRGNSSPSRTPAAPSNSLASCGISRLPPEGSGCPQCRALGPITPSSVFSSEPRF